MERYHDDNDDVELPEMASVSHDSSTVDTSAGDLVITIHSLLQHPWSRSLMFWCLFTVLFSATVAISLTIAGFAGILPAWCAAVFVLSIQSFMIMIIVFCIPTTRFMTNTDRGGRVAHWVVFINIDCCWFIAGFAVYYVTDSATTFATIMVLVLGAGAMILFTGYNTLPQSWNSSMCSTSYIGFLVHSVVIGCVIVFFLHERTDIAMLRFLPSACDDTNNDLLSSRIVTLLSYSARVYNAPTIRINNDKYVPTYCRWRQSEPACMIVSSNPPLPDGWCFDAILGELRLHKVPDHVNTTTLMEFDLSIHCPLSRPIHIREHLKVQVVNDSSLVIANNEPKSACCIDHSARQNVQNDTTITKYWMMLCFLILSTCLVMMLFRDLTIYVH